MDRSLQVTASSVGTEHEDYAGSLNIKGNLLGAMKRYGEAMHAHEEALAIIRRVATAHPVPEVIGPWSKSLATRRLTCCGKRGRATVAGVGVAGRADAHVERGEYGWTEIRFNRGGGAAPARAS